MAQVGRQDPTYSWCGSYQRTQGPMACALADAYGMPPHPWQRTVLNDWLAIGDDGRLLNTTCVLDVPRQNGKTGVADPRETFGLLVRGERILHTAQEYQTARLAFDRLRAKFGSQRNDPNAPFPELNALVANYKMGAGQMALDLTNGAHIEFRTRGSSSDVGRGGTFDLLVHDEAQSYTEEHDAALGSLNSAAPTGSAQTIFMGTVPDPAKPHKGAPFRTLRDRMHLPTPPERACIHEWSVPEIGDPLDSARWYEANPSLGYQLLEDALARDATFMSPDVFAREHLGWWPSTAVAEDRPIDSASWAECVNKDPVKDGLTALAVKFSPDGRSGVIASAVRQPDGRAFVHIVRIVPMPGGLPWFVDYIASRWREVAETVIDGQSNAQGLYDRLVAERVPSRVFGKAKTSDLVAACSSFANAVAEGELCHFGQPMLDAAVCECVKRRIGSGGGWGFKSNGSADATLAEAAALAYWKLQTTRRDPNRKAVVR